MKTKKLVRRAMFIQWPLECLKNANHAKSLEIAIRNVNRKRRALSDAKRELKILMTKLETEE